MTEVVVVIEVIHFPYFHVEAFDKAGISEAMLKPLSCTNPEEVLVHHEMSELLLEANYNDLWCSSGFCNSDRIAERRQLAFFADVKNGTAKLFNMF